MPSSMFRRSEYERCLRAEAVLGLERRALDVDHCDLQRRCPFGVGGGRAEHRGGGEDC